MTTFDLSNPNPQLGDELRDEAANLLSLRFGEARIEYRSDGKKSDVYFLRRDFGKDIRFYVEAKDYNKRLTREQVVHIWADYSGIIAANSPANLLLVTRSGLSADAQSFVQTEQPAMRHQTIWELENDTLGITDYVRSLTEIFKQDGLSAYYVEGYAKIVSYSSKNEHRLVSAEDRPVFAELAAWLDNAEQRPFAVLGGYGAGKTSLALRLIAYQATRALSDPLQRRPILIRLGAFSRYSSLEGILGGMFTHDHPVEGFNARQFLKLNEKGRLLIVLDGFDEMKHAMTWADFRAQIADLNKLVRGNSKVVLLGRPSAFVSMEEEVHVLRGLKRHGDSWRKLPGWPEFIEYELREFTAHERGSFVRKYLEFRNASKPSAEQVSSDRINERVIEVNRLADGEADVFAKPVHAKILTDLAADPSVDLSSFSNGVSRWQLYETFFGSLAERETEKEARRPITEMSRLDFLRETAFWLWTSRGGATSFSAADLPATLLESLSHGDAPDEEALKREYLSGAFLEKKSGDIYYFGHRSFAEFLVADRMLKKPPGPGDHSKYSELLRDGVLVFLKEAPDKSKIAEWSATFGQARGVIRIEYVAFLADVLGSREKLLEAMVPSPLRNALGQLNEFRPPLQSGASRRIVAAMRNPNNSVFHLLLGLILPSASAYATDLAAALLDRVFKEATIDVSGKANISVDADDARRLAAIAIPKIDDAIGGRYLVFALDRLLSNRMENLRRIDVELVGDFIPRAIADKGEIRVNWADVLAKMSSGPARKATEYFRSNDTLRGIFTRQERTIVGRG